MSPFKTIGVKKKLNLETSDPLLDLPQIQRGQLKSKKSKPESTTHISNEQNTFWKKKKRTENYKLNNKNLHK